MQRVRGVGVPVRPIEGVARTAGREPCVRWAKRGKIGVSNGRSREVPELIRRMARKTFDQRNQRAKGPKLK